MSTQTLATPTRSSLHSRPFRLFWAGETVSVFGTTASSVLLPLLAVTTLNASAWWVGLLTAAAWLPWVVIGLPAGAWVDRMDPVPVMVTANVGAGLAVGSVPVAWWLGGLSLPHLGLVALLTGACSVFFKAAYQRLLPQLVAGEDLVGANARLQGSESAAQIAGFGVAGLLAQWVGAAVGLLLEAVSFLISAASITLAARSTPTTPLTMPPRRALRTEIGEGIAFVARDPLLRWFTWAGGVSNFGLTGYGALLVLFLVRDVGVSPGVLGLLLMATSTGALAGAALAGPLSRRFGSARAMVIVQLVAGSTVLLIPFAEDGWRLACYVLGQWTVAFGVVAGNVLKAAFRQGYVPAALMGRVITSVQVINFGLMPVAGVVAGWLGTSVGVRPTVAIMAAVHTVACLTVLASPVRGRRDLPTEPPR